MIIIKLCWVFKPWSDKRIFIFKMVFWQVSFRLTIFQNLPVRNFSRKTSIYVCKFSIIRWDIWLSSYTNKVWCDKRFIWIVIHLIKSMQNPIRMGRGWRQVDFWRVKTNWRTSYWRGKDVLKLKCKDDWLRILFELDVKFDDFVRIFYVERQRRFVKIDLNLWSVELYQAIRYDK